jgi:hypothetical protein
MTIISRLIGAAETKSKFGSLVLKFLAWPYGPLHKIGLTQGNCLLWTPALYHCTLTQGL